MTERVGSILHGAYGDYFEQMVSLKHYKRQNPGIHLVLFFATKSRHRELQVFDLSFADEVHLAETIPEHPVDRFLQFQVRDRELQSDIIAKLPAQIQAQIDINKVNKPWQFLRRIDLKNPANDVGLSDYGRERLPECMRGNGIDDALFENNMTVGFLWRYRPAGDAISNFGQKSESVLMKTKSELLQHFIEKYQAKVLVCGMNVVTTEANRERTDRKYTDKHLDTDLDHTLYLRGLSWGLEIEIMKRCDLCFMMSSGFTEALWIKRTKPTLLMDGQPIYILKLLYNRMPFFDLWNPRSLLFQLRQPHTVKRVLNYLGPIEAYRK